MWQSQRFVEISTQKSHRMMACWWSPTGIFSPTARVKVRNKIIIWNYISVIQYIQFIYCIPNISMFGSISTFWVFFGSPYRSSFYTTKPPRFTNSTAQKVPSLFRLVRVPAAPGAGNENSFKFINDWVGDWYLINVETCTGSTHLVEISLKVCLEKTCTNLNTPTHHPWSLEESLSLLVKLGQFSRSWTNAADAFLGVWYWYLLNTIKMLPKPSRLTLLQSILSQNKKTPTIFI